jgi:cbb3-type cytochrome oxidase cytochrome c subunit
MRHGPLVFLAAFFALSLSWYGLVFTPQVQLGRPMQETNSVAKGELYPNDRPGLARQGLEVYRANGCAYCHSQQVQQDGTLVDVVLTDAGKNTMAVADLLNESHLGNFSGPSVGAGLPKMLKTNATIEAATVLAKNLKTAGAATQLRLVPLGADIERGWGTRRSVAQDFVADATALPGSLRVGPDLANEGNRHRDLNWQYAHLYHPAAMVSSSPMPAYQFLFERKKIESGKQASPDALRLTSNSASGEQYEIVPKAEAKALVAYLNSLSADTPLYEAPVTPPPTASTNAATAMATNAPVTK